MAETTTMSPNWDDIHRDSREVARRLLPFCPFVGLVAVARGGLVPAAIVATELNIRLIETICISSYDGRSRGEMSFRNRLDHDGTGWLVIDDLVDSGETARAVRAMLPNAHYATLYAKPAGRPEVHTFVSEVEQSVWIVFPWEGDDDR